MDGIDSRLKTLRQATRLNQEQVAQRIGVTKSVISGYETGARKPSQKTLVKLAALYNVTTDFLLGRSTEKTLNVSHLKDYQYTALISIKEAFEKQNAENAENVDLQQNYIFGR